MAASHDDRAPNTIRQVRSCEFQDGVTFTLGVKSYILHFLHIHIKQNPLPSRRNKSGSKDQMLFGPAYNVYRCDRSRCNSEKNSFGGVLIAVAAKHVSSSITTRNGSSIEQVCVAATIRGKKFSLCAVYLLPDKSPDVAVFEQHVLTVREICDKALPNGTVLVCGEYNQPRFNWSSNDSQIFCCNSSSFTPASSTLIDGMDFLNMCQYNLVQNFLGRTLDLVFANSASVLVDVNESSAPLLRVDPHHPSLVVSVSFPADFASRNRYTPSDPVLNFRKIDFEALLEYLFNSDWTTILFSNDVDDMAESFCRHISDWLLLNVPVRRPPLSPAWSTVELRKLKRMRNTNQRRLRRYRSSESKNAFRSSCDAYRKLNRSLYKSYVLKVHTNLKCNPKSFWNFVNSKRKYSAIPPTTFLDDEKSNSDADTCEQFAKFFASVFAPNIASDHEVEQAVVDVPADIINLDTFEITQSTITDATNKLKNSFSPGPDGIPAVVFRRCIAALVSPLC
ncbi:uncharacterized protein LOC129728797 [Wyeomyia smithii]|uniref:uncharacterized protein LOC129728797 n=1 Tax=Wyeomyia smithii TaxID=174621 RepID=UPI002467E689|nr:uncharacterized protein LOC129728797 [Wyeomyia smithii]